MDKCWTLVFGRGLDQGDPVFDPAGPAPVDDGPPGVGADEEADDSGVPSRL